MTGSLLVSRAMREAVAPAGIAAIPTRVPAARVSAGSSAGSSSGAKYRPKHRKSRRNSRVGWTGLAALAVVGSTVGWSQVHGEVGAAASGADAATRAAAQAAQPVAAAQGIQTAVTAQPVTCWNGAHAATPKACGTPTGRVGMASVFPAITAACHAGDASRPGTVEVYLCYGSGYVVRYTRWPAGYDRFTRLDQANGSHGTKWTVAGEFAGRTWSTTDVGSDAAHPYRWTVTYRGFPFSVEVSATDAAALAAGTSTVKVAHPGNVGRG